MDYRKLASKQDSLVSKMTGFEIQRNSGACSGHKGDLYTDDLLIETKTCERPKGSFSISKAWMQKLATQAFSMGKNLGILVYSFGDPDQFMTCKLEDFNNLYQENKELRDLNEELKGHIRDLSIKLDEGEEKDEY